MGKTKAARQTKATSKMNSPFQLRDAKEAAQMAESEVHVFGNRIVCDTEGRGHSTPGGHSPLEIVLDASEGFIPLWAKGTVLRWRFQERSMQYFQNPAGAKAAIEDLLGKALLAWGDAVPVSFSKRDDAWDFEIVMKNSPNCNASGCVLASAFFPDAGRHELILYPTLIEQSEQEQIETLVHELGHVFGLRHFFAKVSETAWPAEIFGTHHPFSIMNYGSQSVLTADDKADLKKVYQLAWSGELTKINGTPIKLVRPFHTEAVFTDDLVALRQISAVSPFRSHAAYNGYR
jgi:hypothetical protein